MLLKLRENALRKFVLQRVSCVRRGSCGEAISPLWNVHQGPIRGRRMSRLYPGKQYRVPCRSRECFPSFLPTTEMTLNENVALVIDPLVNPESVGPGQPNSAPRLVKSKLSK